MAEITVKRKNKHTFILKISDDLEQRKSMRLKIHVNTLGALTTYHSNVIEIRYDDDDVNVIAKSIQSILDLASANNISIDLDSEIEEVLQVQKRAEEQSAKTFAALRDIKSGDLHSDKRFISFCNFCDDKMDIQLRDYQYDSAYLLSIGKGGFDFSVPGAGKTIITYASYNYLKDQGEINKIFIIGPGSAFNAWDEEYFVCFGLYPEFENLSTSSIRACQTYLLSSIQYHKEVTFINVEKVRFLKEEISKFLTAEKTMLVIDEAHKIKNPNAAVTGAVLEITKKAAARILLTGTPMPNGYEDLYSMTKVLSPFTDILPFKYSKLQNMTKNGATKKEIAAIHESLDPYYSRISKKYLITHDELPPASSEEIFCHMDAEQTWIYEQLDSFCGKLSDDIDEDFLMCMKKAILIRKMQISANPALLRTSIIKTIDELHSEYEDPNTSKDANMDLLEKADKMIMEQLSESAVFKIVDGYAMGKYKSPKNKMAIDMALKLVSEGKKVLIWDIFVDNMMTLYNTLNKRLPGSVELINGRVHKDERHTAIKRFREGSDILIANPATLAESISLHRVCQYAIYVNLNYNAAQFIQSKDRIHRINMPLGTTAHYSFILNYDSVDTSVIRRLQLKEQRMLAILDADDIVIGGSELEDAGAMSDQDILESYSR